MVVAQIAYNHLSSAVKAKCDALIAVSLPNGSSANNTFVTSACWADDYKSQLGTGIWHYIDLPFSLDASPTNGVSPADFDVVQAIELCVTNLQDSNATPTDQAISLRYLLHFVGDIHQPLHCSTAVFAGKLGGDAGGNGFGLSGGDWSNLHSLWDSGGGFLTDSITRPLSVSDQTTLNSKVAAIEADYPYTPNLGMIFDPMTWAEAGLGLAESVSYTGIARNSTPSTTYLNTAQATTEQLMAQGGHQLADLLTTIFTISPPELNSLKVVNGSFIFSWSATPGKSYRVQWKAQMNASMWNDLPDLVATGSSMSATNQIVSPTRFYRVMVVN